MLNPEVEAALNKQINQEMASAYNYFAMAAWFEKQSLGGFAAWMHQQRMEELQHARRLYGFLLDRGGTIDLAAVAKPQAQFASPREVFARALELEHANTKGIHALYELAQKHKDWATAMEMQWYITEQVEEEKTVSDALALLDLASDNRSAMLVLNNQMKERGAGGGSAG